MARRPPLARFLALLVTSAAAYHVSYPTPLRHQRRRAPALSVARASAAVESPILDAAEAAAFDVARRAAEALRDGARDDALVAASETVLRLVSPANNAARLSPRKFARSINEHRAHYGPLLGFSTLAATAAALSRDGARATVRTGLRDAREKLLGTAVWTLSRVDATSNWLIDAVLVQPAAEAAALEAPPPPPDPPRPAALAGGAPFGALTSPRWVAKTVLSALRRVDEPTKNHGCEVALNFVSKKNPSHKLTPELFRVYLDDDAYPYGVLTRWTDMKPNGVDFDDAKRKASHDVLLEDADGSERTVTVELSRCETSGAWLIDKLWCEEAY